MIDFRPVTLEDQALAKTVICASGCHGADYSFANLFIWRNEYKPLVSFMEERMLLMMPKYDHIYAYPKGGGELEPVMDALFEDAHARGNKLVMRGLTPRTLEEFTPLYGDRFEIVPDRDNADYIYTAEKLCELKGRKLSSKRNHIKHFERNGPWEFRRISGKNTDEARAFVRTFYQEKGDPELEAEANAIREMFTHFDALGFLGGLLLQNSEPVAFTAGTQLDPVTMDVHFEKALPGVDGAYTMINREFARMAVAEFPGTLYFNREEDMGLEGLRRAKESYQPDVLLMKYTAYEK